MAEKPVKRSYGTEEIERGLIAVAFANGNGSQASRDLAEDGIKIPAKTLYAWSRKTKVARYEQIRSTVVEKVRQRAADAHRALAEKQIQISSEATDLLRGKLTEIPARDLPNAVRNLDVGSAIHTDKAQALEGEATVIQVKRELPDVLRALKAKGVDIGFINGSAVEIPEGESEHVQPTGGKELEAGDTPPAER